MRKVHASVVFAALVCFLVIGIQPALAASSKKTIVSRFKKLGLKEVACPKYVTHLKSGLSTSISKPHSVCASQIGRAAKGITKYYQKGTFALSGNDKPGIPFAPVIKQEGDVQTVPFEVQNYPAIISWSVSNANLRSQFTISVVDAATGKNRHVFYRVRGEGADELVWNIPGRYYLKLQAYGDAREDLQPIFSVAIEYLERYEGDRIAKEDLKWAGVKTKACPKYLFDTRSDKYYSLAGYACSQGGDLEGAGFTPAPYSPALEFFMVQEIDWSGAGGNFSLPFRISGPTTLLYSVEDPAEGTGRQGTTTIDLIDLTTGKSVDRLVHVRGTIQGTYTSINIPGDYYFNVSTNPVNPEELGDIEWSLELFGSD